MGKFGLKTLKLLEKNHIFYFKQGRIHSNPVGNATRLDTWLTQLRVGGQGLYLRSFDHLGRSSEDKDRKNPKKGKCDGLTDGQTDGPTKRGVELRSTRLKM